MQLSQYVNTFGQFLKNKYGRRVHKLAINADFTCPNIDGTRGFGGCTFCNNASFNPNGKQAPSIEAQLAAGRAVILRRTGATRYLAYFQAYTNTYADINNLRQLYTEALAQPGVIGLSIGTRPDCVPDPVLDLLAEFQAAGKEIWLELGLQSAFDCTLEKVNRGHTFAEYADAVSRASSRGLPICCHLIVGLPGETREHSLRSLEQIVALGVQGIKIHPLHVVKNTVLAKQWQRGEYTPLTMEEYVDVVSDMILRTPKEVIFHRLTATAQDHLLLAPQWCRHKWRVLNAITENLQQRCNGVTRLQ